MTTEKLDFDNFEDILCEYHEGNLLKGIFAYGFENPSIIQQKSILPIIKGYDVIAQARSGSGKTGAFVIGALARIEAHKKYPQVVIMTNTRELSAQIMFVTKHLSQSTDISISLCIGGNNTQNSFENLREASKSQILIGTTGRILDLLTKDERKSYKHKLFDNLKIIIFDEADMMLSGDFVEKIQDIFHFVPENVQTCFFSATYSPDIINLTNRIAKKPLNILINDDDVSIEYIKNFYVDIDKEDYKYDALVDFYSKLNTCQTIIFVNSVRKAIELTDRLKMDSHSVDSIHSELTDVERCDILKRFRTGATRTLIATDIISRGIDVQQVSLIINYDVPISPEQYIHRVGRSGRYGKLGVAITLNTSKKFDDDRMFSIRDKYKVDFQPLPELELVDEYLKGTYKFESKQLN